MLRHRLSALPKVTPNAVITNSDFFCLVNLVLFGLSTFKFYRAMGRIAWKFPSRALLGRSTGRVASTKYNLQIEASALEHRPVFRANRVPEHILRCNYFSVLYAAMRACAAMRHFVNDELSLFLVFQNACNASPTAVSTGASSWLLSCQLCLVWPSKLRLAT